MSDELAQWRTTVDVTRFFKQSTEDKMKVSQEFSKYFNGYKGPRSTNISPSESVDVKESVSGLGRRHR